MQEQMAEAVKILKSQNFSTAILVLGNVSCDLDSAVCPVVYGLFLQWQHQRLRGRVCTRQYRTEGQGCQQIVVPILNVNREDFELKTEVAYCFGVNHLNKEMLTFRDDIDLKRLLETSDIKVILVDHHILAREDAFLSNRVTEIIDHRPKDIKNWSYGEQVRADIQLVGSCSTLVCDRIRKIEEGHEFLTWFPQCAILLYDTIILDTVNFNKDINKGTPLDLEQIEYLEKLLGVQNAEIHREATLAALTTARADVSSLTAEQLLRKDQKIFADILVPSFPVLVEEVLTRPDIYKALQSQVNRAGCTTAVLLGVHLQTPVRRDLALYCENDNRRDKLAARLIGNAQLKLEELTSPVPSCRYYRQHNLSASRKQIMPIIAEFVELS